MLNHLECMGIVFGQARCLANNNSDYHKTQTFTIEVTHVPISGLLQM